MNHESEDTELLENKLKIYFDKMKHLVTQIPYDIRSIVLYPYMTYQGFKGKIVIDSQGKIGFEIIRKASRIKIETVSIEKELEIPIFGSMGKVNTIVVEGPNNTIVGLVLTNSLFKERFPNEIPKSRAVIVVPPSVGGPFEFKKECSIKIIECIIYWNDIKNKKFIKRIPFVWIFGNLDYVSNLNAEKAAQSDFYSCLFNNLGSAVSEQNTSGIDDLNLKVKRFYLELINRVKSEVKMTSSFTQGDEHIFQDLLDKYKFFLYPQAKDIISQPILSGSFKRKADYRIIVSDNNNIYVEIEPPFFKPFIGINRSQRLEMALKQVKDWQTINEANESINEYWIIIGREQDLDVIEKNALWEFNKSLNKVKIFTWELIINNIEDFEKMANTITI